MTYQSLRSDRSLATGMLNPQTELIFSVNASDPSKFDHTAGRIQFADAYTDTTNPTVHIVDVPARTGITVDNLDTESATFVYLDRNGEIVQKTLLMGDNFLRDHVGCNILIHGDNQTISSSTNFTPVALANTGMSLPDLSFTVGNLIGNQGGRNIVTGVSGANRIDKADGTFYYHSINSRFDEKSPNIRQSPELLGTPLFVAWSTSDNPIGKFVLGPNGGDIEAGVYDDGTAVFADPKPQGIVGDDEWVNNRIFFAVDGDIFFVQYGTQVYPTAFSAIQGLQQESFQVIPSIQASVALATITMRGGSTDASDIFDANIRMAISARAEFI